MLEIADAAREAIESTLREFDAPPSAGPAIRILATSDLPVTPRDLARLLDRDPSTASLIADRLQHAGLIVRVGHPTDGRKRVLELTDHGRELWATLRDRVHATASWDALTATERSQLLGLLTRIRPFQPE